LSQKRIGTEAHWRRSVLAQKRIGAEAAWRRISTLHTTAVTGPRVWDSLVSEIRHNPLRLSSSVHYKTIFLLGPLIDLF